MMENMLQYLPPQDQRAGVLQILRLSDFYGAREFADKVDPPQKGGPQIPQAVQQQLEMEGKLIDTLTKEVHDLKDVLERKEAEAESKKWIAKLEALTRIRVAEISASKDLDKAAADREAAMLEQQMEQAHDAGMASMQMHHANQQQAIDQEHEQAMQESAEPVEPAEAALPQGAE